MSLGLDGRIISQGSVGDTLEEDPRLNMEVSGDQAPIESSKEKIDASESTKPAATSGKLIVPEEIAEGSVSWSPGQYLLVSTVQFFS